MNINEYKLKLSGTANISSELNLSKQYDLTIGDGEITKSQDVPTEDGKIDRIYTLRIAGLSEVNLIRENELVQSKKKGSQSQKLRAVLYEYHSQQYSGDFEQFYIKEMNNIIESYKSKLN